MDAKEERRRFVRLNVLADVVYKKHVDLDNEKITLTKNISKGGICLIAYEELKEEDFVDLSIYLPEEEKPINAVGRVAWVNEFIIGDPRHKKFDVGVEFIEIKEEDINKIDKYVFGHVRYN